MAFTYADIISDARVDLKDSSGTTYKDTPMLKWANDAVQICRKVTARICPELIQSSVAVSLLTANAGPYDLPVSLETPLRMLDEDGYEVGDSYRGEYSVSNRSGKPDGWWIEGYNPPQALMNSTPNQAYAWTLYYIATVARAAAAADTITLPDFLREKLAKWLTWYAANSKEFDVASESDQIKMMEELTADILVSRRPAMELRISGVGF